MQRTRNAAVRVLNVKKGSIIKVSFKIFKDDFNRIELLLVFFYNF